MYYNLEAICFVLSPCGVKMVFILPAFVVAFHFAFELNQLHFLIIKLIGNQDLQYHGCSSHHIHPTSMTHGVDAVSRGQITKVHAG